MASIYLNSCAAAKRLAARPSSFRQQWLLHPAVTVGAFFCLPVPAASGDMFRPHPSHSLACCSSLLRIPDGATVQASIGTYQLSDASRRAGGGGRLEEPRHRMVAFPGRPVDPVGRNILRSRQRAVEHRLRKV